MPNSWGGIADYAHDQAEALHALGHHVIVAAPPGFHQRNCAYRRDSRMVEARPGLLVGGRLFRRVRLSISLMKNYRRLVGLVQDERPDHLITHFEEYLAPLWVPMLRRLKKNSIRMHTILHDPNRSYKVGPIWWHKWSVNAAFSLYDTVFVHHRDARLLKHYKYLPYGIHAYPPPNKRKDEVRRAYGIGSGKYLFIAFGYIRDNKNLDLAIRALAVNPDAELLIAGPEMGGGQKPLAYYRELAARVGVDKRCHFDIRFLSQAETANLVSAADFGLLTYARSFVSASAAFSVYANYEITVLVSSGSAEMERITRQYNLGHWVEPDDATAVADGMRKMIDNPPVARWISYKEDHSWRRNAEIVVAAMARNVQDDA